jgi:hypothetical protein
VLRKGGRGLQVRWQWWWFAQIVGVRRGVGSGNVNRRLAEGCVPSLQPQIASIKLETKLRDSASHV